MAEWGIHVETQTDDNGCREPDMAEPTSSLRYSLFLSTLAHFGAGRHINFFQAFQWLETLISSKHFNGLKSCCKKAEGCDGTSGVHGISLCNVRCCRKKRILKRPTNRRKQPASVRLTIRRNGYDGKFVSSAIDVVLDNRSVENGLLYVSFFFFLFICLSNSLSLVGCTAKWKNQKKKIKKKREKKRRESVLLLKRKKKTRIYRIKKILRMLISETRYSLFASDACPNITHCALLSFPFGLAPIIA